MRSSTVSDFLRSFMVAFCCILPKTSAISTGFKVGGFFLNKQSVRCSFWHCKQGKRVMEPDYSLLVPGGTVRCSKGAQGFLCK